MTKTCKLCCRHFRVVHSASSVFTFCFSLQKCCSLFYLSSIARSRALLPSTEGCVLCFISWCDVTAEEGESRRELGQFRSGKWQNGEHKRRVEILCFSLSLQAVFVLIKFLPYPFCVTAQVSDRDKGSILPVSKNYVFTIFFN